MNLAGLKSLLGNAAELLKSDKTESPQPTGLLDVSKKDKNDNGFAKNILYDDRATKAVINRFVEARNTNESGAASSPKLYSAQTNSNQTYTPKAVIIPLKEGSENATHAELSRRLIQATLEQNGIRPSNVEMEEMMALPQNQRIDMNGTFDKNWKHHDLPGSMPAPAKFKDINGREVFGYGFKLPPQWQADKLNDYKQVRGELSKPGNVDRKAVIDMKMTERLNEMIKIAWEKGYISEEVKNQLGSLTPEELAGAFAIGGVIGIIGTTEAGAAALGPVGGAIGLAYTIKQMAEFDHIADGCAMATNRQQLDKPAKEFGAFLGSLSKDGVLALVGMASGAIAPRVMPRIEEALTNKVGNVKQILKDGLPKLEEPRLATPDGAPVQPIIIKVPKGKTALENNEPLKIVTVDSNGKPSGTRFRDDYSTHIKEREFSKASQKSGVNGAHNLDELEKYAIKSGAIQTKESINIISKTPHPTVKGIYKVEYQMPKLDTKGQTTGLWRYKSGTDPFVKTVYDAKLVSDAQMTQWGREAFADAVKNGFSGNSGNKWTGTASNGLKIEGFIDKQGTNAVRTFYPDF